MESSIGISPTSGVVDGRSRRQPKTFDGSSGCFPSVTYDKRLLGNARLDCNLHRSSSPRFVICSKSRLWQDGKGKTCFPFSRVCLVFLFPTRTGPWERVSFSAPTLCLLNTDFITAAGRRRGAAAGRRRGAAVGRRRGVAAGRRR